MLPAFAACTDSLNDFIDIDWFGRSTLGLLKADGDFSPEVFQFSLMQIVPFLEQPKPVTDYLACCLVEASTHLLVYELCEFFC